MAYTLTGDQNAQRKVYKAQGNYHNAHTIKRLLTENKADADGKLAKFVGIAAYQKAGGKSAAISSAMISISMMQRSCKKTGQ